MDSAEGRFLIFTLLVVFLTVGALVWAVQNAPLLGVVALLAQVIGINLAASWHLDWRFRTYEEQMQALGLEDPDGARLFAFNGWQAMERDGIFPNPRHFKDYSDGLRGSWGWTRSMVPARSLVWFLPALVFGAQISKVYILVAMICFGDDAESRVEDLQDWRRGNPGRRWPWADA